MHDGHVEPVSSSLGPHPHSHPTSPAAALAWQSPQSPCLNTNRRGDTLFLQTRLDSAGTSGEARGGGVLGHSWLERLGLRLEELETFIVADMMAMAMAAKASNPLPQLVASSRVGQSIISHRWRQLCSAQKTLAQCLCEVECLPTWHLCPAPCSAPPTASATGPQATQVKRRSRWAPASLAARSASVISGEVSTTLAGVLATMASARATSGTSCTRGKSRSSSAGRRFGLP